MGNALARAVLEELPRTPLTNKVVFGMSALQVALPPLNARITDGLRLRPWVARRFLPVQEDTLLLGFRLEDAVWVSPPATSAANWLWH